MYKLCNNYFIANDGPGHNVAAGSVPMLFKVALCTTYRCSQPGSIIRSLRLTPKTRPTIGSRIISLLGLHAANGWLILTRDHHGCDHLMAVGQKAAAKKKSNGQQKSLPYDTQ